MRMGVIVMGSLLWDPDPKREAWRSACLDLDARVPAQLPIRYGRQSSTRANGYTMVFSNQCHELGLGMGWVIPLRKPVASGADVLEQAQHMGRAEGFKAPVQHRYAKWGTLALAIRPEWDPPAGVISSWAAAITPNRRLRSIRTAHIPLEQPTLTSEGLLCIGWPDAAAGLDLLVATVTRPNRLEEQGGYPTAERVAAAMQEPNAAREYFEGNRKEGITTFQDQDILELL